MIENLDQIKLAIDVEVKYKYIDIRGKAQCFSAFIKNEARKIYKTSGKIRAGRLLLKLLSITLLPH